MNHVRVGTRNILFALASVKIIQVFYLIHYNMETAEFVNQLVAESRRFSNGLGAISS